MPGIWLCFAYTYDLFFGEWTTFPLSEGSGRYGVSVYENAGGSRYATVVGISFDVSLIDEFAPFLIPNTYVDYQNAANTIQTSEELAGQLTDALAKVDAIYSYMIQNVSYDYVQAATVKSGYIPDLDRVLKRKRGICFDYASLMTAMLRLRGVPCKLVFGYVGQAYHAWIRVWSDEEGWVDAVYFDAPPLRAYAERSGGRFVATPLVARDSYGVAVDKRRPDVLAAANAVIAEGGRR